MAVTFECGCCGKPIKARDELTGKKVKCPKCGGLSLVPQDTGEEIPQADLDKQDCPFCGEEILTTANKCKHCGEFIDDEEDEGMNIKKAGRRSKSSRRTTGRRSSGNGKGSDWLVTLLLCFFLGWLGVHRFYTGHTVYGVIQLVSFGGCGIWNLIDFIIILVGSYTDANGKPLIRKI